MPIAQDIPVNTGYALDSTWHAERQRLNSLTSLYDRGTLALCDGLGVANGWQCLDVGAGTGSLAEALTARVAPEGGVVALDIDTRFLEPLASPHLTVVKADVTCDPLPPAEFDLVHSRLLLEHLPDRDQVLADIVAAAKPGGWVLVEDFDWATALLVDPPSSVHERVATGIRDLFTRHGYDPNYGRTLAHRLKAAGLAGVETRAEAIQVRADREKGLPQWELLAEQFAPALLASGLITDDDLAEFVALCHDPRTICFSPLMVSCWGRRS
jgi:ubiquinone/menaquinone biosynthesis C-methylase UbiE